METPINTDNYFCVSLIKVGDTLTSDQAMELARNCTPVANGYWIYEGDSDALDLPFLYVSAGVVGPLGEATHEMLVKICQDVFGVDVMRSENGY